MAFTLTIDGFRLNVQPNAHSPGEIGKAGSVLDLALTHGIRLAHSCGGVGACTTCHIYVHQGLKTCSPVSTAEASRLKEVYGVKTNSRLACQCIPGGNGDIVVEIP